MAKNSLVTYEKADSQISEDKARKNILYFLFWPRQSNRDQIYPLQHLKKWEGNKTIVRKTLTALQVAETDP